MSAPVSTARADRLSERATARELDLLLVSRLVNVRWLTGFSGTSAAAVIGRDGTRRFVTDFRYLTQSAEELDPAEYGAGLERLRRLVAWLRPSLLCVVGLTGWRAAVAARWSR